MNLMFIERNGRQVLQLCTQRGWGKGEIWVDVPGQEVPIRDIEVVKAKDFVNVKIYENGGAVIYSDYDSFLKAEGLERKQEVPIHGCDIHEYKGNTPCPYHHDIDVPKHANGTKPSGICSKHQMPWPGCGICYPEKAQEPSRGMPDNWKTLEYVEPDSFKKGFWNSVKIINEKNAELQKAHENIEALSSQVSVLEKENLELSKEKHEPLITGKADTPPEGTKKPREFWIHIPTEIGKTMEVYRFPMLLGKDSYKETIHVTEIHEGYKLVSLREINDAWHRGKLPNDSAAFIDLCRELGLE